jgi:hypothetical protein
MSDTGAHFDNLLRSAAVSQTSRSNCDKRMAYVPATRCG